MPRSPRNEKMANTEKFRKDHINGKQKKNKKINHVGEFDKAEYKDVRLVGAEKNQKISGKKPEEYLVVTKKPISYIQNGKQNVDRSGEGYFAIQGKMGTTKFRPHHLEGKVEHVPKDGNSKTKFKHGSKQLEFITINRTVRMKDNS